MSNRSSQSPPPESPPSSPPPFAYSHRLGPTDSIPLMIHVGRPTPIAPPTFSALTSHYTPGSSRFIADSDNYSSTFSRPQTTETTSNRHATPPESMRASDHDRGVKRARSEDVEDEGEDRQGSVSGSDASEHAEQPIMPAPKKRTRTLMTPDQLTALHRLLSQTRFPTTEQREQCGREIGLSARRVQVWFQNQRQKSKAQQQASSAAGGSRQALGLQTSGPYQVFNYNPSHYDPPHPRPYTSPHSYTYGEPMRHTVDTSPLLRRTSQRLAHHRRGSLSQSYYAPHGSGSYEFRSGTYAPPPYTLAEPEYARSPASYYDRYQSPPRVRSPLPASSVPREDTTLPPIWPENEQPRGESGALSHSPTSSTNPALSRRPSLLPTGLPPPQPLEPTPIWNHPHTNPRYMRPLPAASGLPSLLSELGRGRARSDPPLASSQVSNASARSDRGLGLELFGTRPASNPEVREGAPTSPERTHSVPTALDSRRPLLAESSPRSGEPAESESEPTRPQTSRGLTHSRRSSGAVSRD
ncbi:unnamed protein product [Rhizoctonia solani]|uniref:Homeobox domain-containing protein n=1 Tax=Rhizoctonia solani TaxID=456999 RepID=A0A8H2XUZ4_9AGAM|nr:unnamed protein product [Rhizoctonia solani]